MTSLQEPKLNDKGLVEINQKAPSKFQSENADGHLIDQHPNTERENQNKELLKQMLGDRKNIQSNAKSQSMSPAQNLGKNGKFQQNKGEQNGKLDQQSTDQKEQLNNHSSSTNSLDLDGHQQYATENIREQENKEHRKKGDNKDTEMKILPKSSSKQQINRNSYQQQRNQIPQPEQNINQRTIDSLYDPFAYPPNIRNSFKHGRASMLGIVRDRSQVEKQLCQCCNNQIDKPLLPLMCDAKDMGFLGLAFPMYFRLVKTYLVIFLVFLVVSGSAILILENFDCQKQCVRFLGFPVLNLETFLNQVQDPAEDINNHVLEGKKYKMMLISVFLLLISLYVKHQITHYLPKYRVSYLTASRYTLLVRNLPRDLKEGELEEFFYSITKAGIFKINYVYDIERYEELFDQKIQQFVKVQEVVLQLQKLNQEIKRKSNQGKSETSNRKQIYDPLISSQNLGISLDSSDQELQLSAQNNNNRNFDLPNQIQPLTNLRKENPQMYKEILSQFKYHKSLYEKAHTKIKEFADEQQKAASIEILENRNSRINKIKRKFNLPSEIKPQMEISKHFIGTAFVTFNSIIPSRVINKKWGQSFCRDVQYFLSRVFSCFGNPYLNLRETNHNAIIFSPAPPPTTVMWRNLQFSFKRKYMNQIYTFLLGFLILIGSFFVQYEILMHVYPYKQQSIYQTNNYVVQFRAALMSLVIFIVNNRLRWLVYLMVDYQRPESLSMYNSSFMNRYILLCFFNSGIMPYLVHFQMDEKQELRELLINDVHFILLGTAAGGLAPLFNPTFFVKQYQQWKTQRMTKYNECPYPQHKLNQIFEYTQVDIAGFYCHLYLSILLSFWYGDIAPLGILFSLVGLALTYWVHQIVLLRFSKMPRFQGEELLELLNKTVGLYALLYAGGSMIFYSKMVYSSNNFVKIASVHFEMGVIFLAVFVAFLVFIIKFRDKNNEDIDEQDLDEEYQKVRFKFRTEYDRENPVTQIRANHQFLIDLQEKKNQDNQYPQHSTPKNKNQTNTPNSNQKEKTESENQRNSFFARVEFFGGQIINSEDQVYQLKREQQINTIYNQNPVMVPVERIEEVNSNASDTSIRDNKSDQQRQKSPYYLNNNNNNKSPNQNANIKNVTKKLFE